MHGRRTLVLLWVLVSCQSRVRDERTPHDWLIIPATRIGPVDATASEQDLIDLLGADAIVRRDLDVGEGLCAPGSVLYAGTPEAVAVTWMDSMYSRPALVEV